MATNTDSNTSVVGKSNTQSSHDSTKTVQISNEKESLNSAASTALSCPSERLLRVPCYCEENVWRLVHRKLHSTDDKDNNNENDDTQKEYHVVFISNKEKCCPMFHQLAKEEDSLEPCLWDYHVILICTITKEERSKSSTVVLDMDSRAPYPCSLQEYLWLSFRNLEFVHEDYRDKYAPKFRVIKATDYLTHFYSDRMHMFNTKTNTWHAKPPTYDCIMNGLEVEEQQKHRRIQQKQSNSSTETTLLNLIQSGDKIGSDGRCSNLDTYMDMTQAKKNIHLVGDDSAIKNENHTDICNMGERKKQVYGDVFTLEEFQKEFCS